MFKKVLYPSILDLPDPVVNQLAGVLDSSAVNSWRNLVDHLEDYNQQDILRLRNIRDYGGSPTKALFKDLHPIGWTILDLAELARKAKINSVIDILVQYCQDVGLDTSELTTPTNDMTADSASASWKGAKSCSHRAGYPSVIPPPIYAREEAVRRYGLQNESTGTEEAAVAIPPTETTPIATPISSLPGLVQIQYKVLYEAAGHFNKAPLESGGHKLGEGGFGEVFYCALDLGEGRVEAAVKVLRNKDDITGDCNSTFGSINKEQFSTEVSALSRLNHNNLLSLLAYSNDGDKLCLVYPFMVRGSLDKYIADVTSLSTSARVGVARDIASALEYLHGGVAGEQIVHRDVKSANVLIALDWTAKLGDFGVARIIPSEATSLMTTTIVGTMIFMAPEYRTGTVTPAADVYAFGVLLFELLTGRSALDKVHNKETAEDTDLITYIQELEDDPADILIGQWDKEVQKGVWSMAEKCVEHYNFQRPSSKDVYDAIVKLCSQL